MWFTRVPSLLVRYAGYSRRAERTNRAGIYFKCGSDCQEASANREFAGGLDGDSPLHHRLWRTHIRGHHTLMIRTGFVFVVGKIGLGKTMGSFLRHIISRGKRSGVFNTDASVIAKSGSIGSVWPFARSGGECHYSLENMRGASAHGNQIAALC